MSTDATQFRRADAYAHARPRGSRVVLALTLGLHLLAAWWWLQQRPAHPPRAPDTPSVVTILLQLPRSSQAPASAPAQPDRTAPAPRRAENRPAAGSPAHEPAADSLPAPSPAITSGSTATPAPAPASTPATFQPPGSATTTQTTPGDSTAAAPATVDGGFTASLDRRQAGRIDRELRGGKSGVPTEADTPWARFQRGIEAAHNDGSMSARLDSYTSPDGVVIYRRRVGGRIACYRTGSVAGGVDSAIGALGVGGANDAGAIPCPSSAQWKREE